MVFMETGFVSLKKYKEELCGDRVEVISGEDSVTMVLADGLGSGVKANILATLTSKIIGTMVANGLAIDDAVSTIALTLPVCSQRHIAYSTFSIVHMHDDGRAELIQYDNPPAILVHEGACTRYKSRAVEVCGKAIQQSTLHLVPGDMLLLISDGVVHAGVGRIYNLGWRQENVEEFVRGQYTPGLSAKGMAATLAGACRQLYIEEPGDDATVAVLRVKESVPVSVMVGPPSRVEDDVPMVKAFLESPGKKVVCGGTTAEIVADYLHAPLETLPDYPDPDVPPIATIRGIDLATEGVLTLGRALTLCEGYASADEEHAELKGRDGASLLAHMLLEEATDICFFVGRAVNPAYRDADGPVGPDLKQRLVEELMENLKSQGRRVTARYF